MRNQQEGRMIGTTTNCDYDQSYSIGHSWCPIWAALGHFKNPPFFSWVSTVLFVLLMRAWWHFNDVCALSTLLPAVHSTSYFPRTTVDRGLALMMVVRKKNSSWWLLLCAAVREFYHDFLKGLVRGLVGGLGSGQQRRRGAWRRTSERGGEER